MQNPYAHYKQTAVQTASPEKLLIMLYDGAIKFGNQAQEALEQKDLEASNTYIGKMQDIIGELMVTLNMDYDISKNLFGLYEYINSRLITANIRKDPEPLLEVMGYLKELRGAFAQAAVLAKAQEGQVVNGAVNFEG
ncbi:MAG: flagellar export chaperone FliS [Clostridia bacterium]|nr:flagellar export chaperone FliS [Clostridia bacterium]